MARHEPKKGLPTPSQIVEAYRDPVSLVAVGDSAIDHVMGTVFQYYEKWTESLVRAVAKLKDVVESGSPMNSAAAELMLLLLRPKTISRTLSRAEIDDVAEPSEEEIEAWAWGSDLARTAVFL